jgi:hypothetical protein
MPDRCQHINAFYWQPKTGNHKPIKETETSHATNAISARYQRDEGAKRARNIKGLNKINT